MKKLLFLSIIAGAVYACSPKAETNEGLEKYKKNVEVAKQFIEAFSTGDSTKEASLLSDSLKWTGPAIGQDSLPKDSLLTSDKQMMKAFKDVQLTKTEFVPGVDSKTYQFDGEVRVYGTWVSKSVSSGKTTKLKYYAVFGFNDSGKITSLEEYANMDDLNKEY